jgi:phosphatidate phosphatase APP1
VISDIDDTVIETGATDLRANWRRILLHAPSERLAVPGAAALYRAIARDHAAPARPFFYVSSSPWNLYGFLAEFMEMNAIPHGAMFLKDWGIDRDTLLMASHDALKLAAIREILGFYPEFRFLLVGDNGERDVHIYAAIVAEFGARVAAVFIRDVTGTCRQGEKAELLRGIEAAGVPTFCGGGFDDAVAVFTALELDRPREAAKAVAEPEGPR